MGHIKEPKGVDLIVNPIPLSTEDREAISAIIAEFKHTGKMPSKKWEKPENTTQKSKAKAKKLTVKKSNKTSLA